MQLKDLGNLSNVLKSLNGSNNISEYFNSLNLSMQQCLLTSGKLTEAQLVSINQNTAWKTGFDGANISLTGLTQKEIETAISTTALSSSQTVATATTTGFSTALKGLWATMLANPLILVATAVTAGITAWNIYQQSVEKTRQATADATSTFNDTTTSINDYADKYKKLHDELTDANTSEERQHEIKSDLLSLQQELNDKYGEEYGRLNLVTDAYKDQTEAILSMNRASAKNYLLENRKGIDDATRKMEQDRTYSLGSTGYMSNDYAQELYKIASQYTDRGIDLTQFSSGNETGYTIEFTGNAEQADKVIHDLANQIQDLEEKFKDNNFVKSFLDNSENALKANNKILDDYQDIYNNSLIAQIAADNTLSEGYANATNAVNKYNEAIASGDESKILSARKNLDNVKSSIDLTSDDWKRYGTIMINVFDQADTGLYDFEDSLKSNKDGLMNFAKTLRGISKEDILAISNAGDNENFEKLKKAADEYGLSAEDVIAVLERLKIVQGDVGKFGEAAFTPLSKQEVISNISSLSEGFESLDKIMKSISDKDNAFDYALLDDKKFKDNFKDLGESYTDFVEKVSSSPKDINVTKSAFNDLVTTWIDSSGVLNGLTDENANLATTMLQNMGVANAEEVVMSRLAIAQEHLAAEKAYTAEVSNDLANATANEIPGIIDEATQSDIAKVALAGLVLEKEFFNGNSLDTSGDIENILSLVGVIGTANTALQALNTLKAGGNVGYRIGKEGYDSIVKNAQQEVDAAIKAASEYKGKGSSTNASYNGVKSNKPSGSGSKKDKKETEKPIDWIARGTKVVKDSYAELEELANKDTIAYLGLTQEEFDKAKSIFENGLGNTIDGLSQLQSYADKAGLSLGELYTMIQSGAPGASKENALQSMLQMQTETLLPQYQREVEAYSKAYEDALKEIPSEYRDKVENGGEGIESLPSDLAEKVQKAIDANEKLKSSEKQLADGEKEHIATIKELHENRINAIDIENEKLQQSNKIIKSQIELMEARGEIVDADFYKRQINNNKGLISGNQQNITEWESEMADLRAANVSTNSKEYKELQARVKAAKNEIYGLKLEQEEFNQKLKQMPIDNLSTIISMYGDITAKIENWGAVHTATGAKLNTDYYQTLISNGATVIGQYEKQIKEIKSLMSEYQKGSTVWQELYNQLQDIDSATASMLTNLQKWNEELLKMPLDNINTYSDSLQKVITGLNGVKSELDSVTSAITTAISDQINLLEEEQKAATDARQAEIDALQEKADLLEKTNEKLKLQMSLELAEYNLARSLSQKVNKEVRNGEEVYVEDYDAVRKAKEDKIDAQFNIDKYNLEQQIEDAKTALDDLNDSYQDQIDALEKISKKYSEISSAAEKISNANLATSLFGEGFADKVLAGNDKEIYDTLTSLYQTNAKQLDEFQKQADSTSNIQTLIENYIDSYKNGTITYAEAMTKINGLLSQMNESMTAMDNLQNIYDYLGTVNGVGADADSILKGIKDGLAVTADELAKSLEQYNKNYGVISEYTSSWEQLTNNVSSMLDVLKQVRDNLRNALDDYDSGDDDEPYDKSRGKGWGTGDVNNGPGVYADGIKNGLVGSSSDTEREKMIKYLSTNELKTGEVPIIAHEGEAILNSDQQEQLLDNVDTSPRLDNVDAPPSSDIETVFNKLGLKKLDPGELPMVLHNKEVIFPEEWQKAFADKLATMQNYKPNIPDYSSTLNNVKALDRSATPTINFNGGITIEKCDTPDEFAKGIMDGKLALALGQRLGRR